MYVKCLRFDVADDKLDAGVHCLSNCMIGYLFLLETFSARPYSCRVGNLCVHAFNLIQLYCIDCSLLGKHPRQCCRNSLVNGVQAGRIRTQVIGSHGVLRDEQEFPNFLCVYYKSFEILRIPSQENNCIIHKDIFLGDFSVALSHSHLLLINNLPHSHGLFMWKQIGSTLCGAPSGVSACCQCTYSRLHVQRANPTYV